LQFSDTSNNTGILQQSRILARVDATQWPTARVVNSTNNWLDRVTGYAIGADRRFQWDDSNHTALPEGTAQLTINVSDYSFLTDEQGNTILSLLGISRLDGTSWVPLTLVNRDDPTVDWSRFGVDSGTPTQYDKIADNIVRLNKKPSATIAGGLKFFFQRSPSYFTASDTTKQPGVAPVLHRGFVVASAYDIALTLGLANLQPLSVELAKEEQKMIEYFAGRNNDEVRRMSVAVEDNQ